MIDRSRSGLLRALIFAAPVAACGGSGTSPAVPDGGGEAGGPEFSQVYSTIVSPRCLPCHSNSTLGGVLYGKLDMSSQETAYSNLVGVKAAGSSCVTSNLIRVVPGSAATSLMFNKVNAKLMQIGAPCGDTMPDDQTVLDQAQVDLIETWINDGAQR
jgi:hypothetical protein